MTDLSASGGAPLASAPRGAAAASATEDRSLAALHLRLGMLVLARAELEDLRRRDALDADGLADLAEARWRTGDLDEAAVAAGEHLAAGGARPIARVAAAEAAAAAGRPGEARAHVDAVRGLNAETLDRLFSGMPRRAPWASGPGAVGVPAGVPSGAEPGRRAGAATRAPERPFDSADQLERARDEIGSRNTGEAARGLTRLSLVLRLDPALAPAVLDAVGPRNDPGALLVRGEAFLLLGRHLEAEAAFNAAGRGLDATAARGRRQDPGAAS